ncbi:MAG: prephenate dehydrogenase/arogenate dehydrogenase family protein [Candidatus Hydrogenedentes bacterium]|nr:prephenate dehydrogenase/arogenate dehydrogenase family protein [Candidatus Hydrogenedentota bacterium]
MNGPYDTATIIGVGLLGASLGLALKERGLARTVRGVGHRSSTLDTALARGAIDEASLEPETACAGAGLVVVCVPAALVAGTLDTIRPVCPPNAVITDVASTKESICRHAAATWPTPRRFVGSHPMAGSEKFGPEHATPTLYQDSITIMEPRAAAHADDAWDAVAALWRALGSTVVEIAPDLHDALVARTSHIPHITAACLAELAADRDGVQAVVGAGFRDVTRIAAGRPEIWRDICLTNSQAIVEGLDEFMKRLADLRRLVHAGDGPALDAFFRAAQSARTKVVGE